MSWSCCVVCERVNYTVWLAGRAGELDRWWSYVSRGL